MTIEELEREIELHDYQYHKLNAPVIPDEEYDLLTRRLRELKPDSPVLHRVGSEGLDAGALGEKVVHASPMLSLDKCYSDQEYRDWLDFVERTVHPAGGAAALQVTVSPKVDGVAASLRYGADGNLAQAATRGDGVVGEDFTVNARLISGIPWHVDRPGIEVRGEVYMKRSVFDAKYKGQFSNTRNLTAGTLKQKEGAREQLLDLTFLAYDLRGADVQTEHNLRGADVATEHEKMALLSSLGFVPVETIMDRADSVPAHFLKLVERRASWEFDADGVVAKLDDVRLHEQLGGTAHHPRFAIAYKFQGDTGFTRLVSVEWSVSRTGTITPVATVEPVVLSGARISRSSLHNLKILSGLGLRLGDQVQITRRGGVIPNVEASLGGGTTPVEVPSRCPSCSAPTLGIAPQLFIGGVRLPHDSDVDMIRAVARSRRPKPDDNALLSPLDRDNAVARRGGDPRYIEHLTWVSRGKSPTPPQHVKSLREFLDSLPSIPNPGFRATALLVFDPTVPTCRSLLPLVQQISKEESLRLLVLPVLEPKLAPDAAGTARIAAWRSKAEDLSDGVLTCSAPSTCPAAVVGTLEHFVGTIGVEGFGRKVLENLYASNLLRHREGFFNLTEEQLNPLERMGDLLASKLIDNVHTARVLPLAVFLESLGIEELAKSVSAKLQERCSTIDEVLALSEEDVGKILKSATGKIARAEAGSEEGAQGSGDTSQHAKKAAAERTSRIAFCVYHGLRRNRDAIRKLLEYVEIRSPDASAPKGATGDLAGRTFVFTGKMRTLQRKDAAAKVEALGGKAMQDVTRDLDFLVVGDEGSPLFGQGAKGSKMLKAEKLIGQGAKVRIISEGDFIRMIK